MVNYFVREPLNGEECDRLVNACESFREKMVIWSLLDTGLRVSEFCDLRRKDIQWQENQLVIWGKRKKLAFRKKRRIVPLTPRVRQLFEIHFTTNEGFSFSVRTVQLLIKIVANRAMITSKPVSPHVLRHSFAVNCIKKGLSVASLSKIMGHERVETTAIYLNICPEDALIEFFRKIVGSRSRQWME